MADHTITLDADTEDILEAMLLKLNRQSVKAGLPEITSEELLLKILDKEFSPLRAQVLNEKAIAIINRYHVDPDFRTKLREFLTVASPEVEAIGKPSIEPEPEPEPVKLNPIATEPKIGPF